MAALKRAAKQALALARKTGTPCWVMRDGKMIDIAKRHVVAAKCAMVMMRFLRLNMVLQPKQPINLPL